MASNGQIKKAESEKIKVECQDNDSINEYRVNTHTHTHTFRWNETRKIFSARYSILLRMKENTRVSEVELKMGKITRKRVFAKREGERDAHTQTSERTRKKESIIQSKQSSWLMTFQTIGCILSYSSFYLSLSLSLARSISISSVYECELDDSILY